MYSGPPGFYKAPVTKVFLGLVGAASLVSLSSPVLRQQWALTYQALFVEGQLWRLIPCSLAFQSLPELGLGLYLLYFFRLFERLYGSSKYVVFLLFAFLISAALEALLLLGLGPHHHGDPDAALDDPQAPSGSPWLSYFTHPVCGPYGVIFASYVLYALDVPPTARFTIFSVLNLTDKALLYFAGFQLLVSSWYQSLVPGFCGLWAGLLYRANLFGLRKAQMPAPIVAAAAHYFSFVFSRPPVQSTLGRPSLPGSGTGAAAPAGPGALPTAWTQGASGRSPGTAGFNASRQAAAAPPPQGAIDQLLAMGFEREAAVQALAQAHNDLTLATNLLLESQQLA